SLYSRLNIRLCIHALQFQEEHLNSMSMKPAAGQPATNHEQAVLLRKNNKSGISGVRHVELAEDEAWEASLLTQNTSARSSPYANMVRSKRKPWQSHCAENDWRNCRSNTWLMQNTQRR
ncbi:hypothetical protein B7W85_25390, partial [Allorhizobium ampelinum]